jgi:recombination protein RecA
MLPNECSLFYLAICEKKGMIEHRRLFLSRLRGEICLSDRKAALEMALRQIEKQFGKGSIMRLGEVAETQVSTVSSGALALDIALGVGGYPRGRIIEIFGPESSGKTTGALHAIAEVQKIGGQAAFIDAEHGATCC